MITSKTSWQVGSNVTIECIFTDGLKQTLDKIVFGLMAGSDPQKLITVQSSSGLVIETTPWPAKWTWYWVGDLVSKKVAFRLTKAALNDSRTFYCEVQWSGSFESKSATTSILITGL